MDKTKGISKVYITDYENLDTFIVNWRIVRDDKNGRKIEYSMPVLNDWVGELNNMEEIYSKINKILPNLNLKEQKQILKEKVRNSLMILVQQITDQQISSLKSTWLKQGVKILIQFKYPKNAKECIKFNKDKTFSIKLSFESTITNLS